MTPSKDKDLSAAKMIKKKVTERVLLANRENGRKGSGPRNTLNTRYSATKHSLLTKDVRFRDELEEKEFLKFSAELTRDLNPLGLTEQNLVAEIAIAQWRLGKVYALEFLEVKNRQNAATAILEGMRENVEAQELSFFAAAQPGWSARELTVRTGSRNTGEDALLGEKTDKIGHVIVEAKMSSSLDTLLRYSASIKRDFYKALEVLRQLQRERLESDSYLPSSRGEV